MKLTYDKVINKILSIGITEEELKEKIYLAQQWHNPLNYDDGSSIKKKHGWNNLFSDYFKDEGRFYFYFHNHDMTDIDNVINLFYNCPNFKKYSKIWKSQAPVGLKSPLLYLVAITAMTVKGFKHEEYMINRLKQLGHKVETSSGRDDYRGVDIYVDGQAVQLKSPKTLKNMKSELNGIKIM